MSETSENTRIITDEDPCVLSEKLSSLHGSGMQVIREKNQMMIKTVLEGIAPNTMKNVSIEGTPFYVHEGWNERHNYSYNEALPLLYIALREHEYMVTHDGLIDEYSEHANSDMTDSFRSLISQKSVLRFNRFTHESAMKTQASHIVNLFDMHDAVKKTSNGHLALNAKGSPLLQKSTGQYSCPLLDCAFQMQKKTDIAILVHPESFSGQQTDMQAIYAMYHWFQLLQTVRNALLKIVDTTIQPSIEPNRVNEAVNKIRQDVQQVITEHAGQPKITAPAFADAILSTFKHFKKAERKTGRFAGVNDRLDSLAASVRNFLPTMFINVYFDENTIRPTKVSSFKNDTSRFTTHLNGHHSS